MRKVCFYIMMFLFFFSLIGCKSNNDTITVKNGDYVMEYEDTEAILLPHVTISDDQILFAHDLLSSYLPLGTYSITDDILTMTTSDNKYIYVFQIDGDNLVFLKDKSSSVSLIDDRFRVKINDKAIFSLKED